MEINARKMEGLTRAEAMDWLKASETATLVLERISEAPAQQLQQSSQFSSFEGVCDKVFFFFFNFPLCCSKIFKDLKGCLLLQKL